MAHRQSYRYDSIVQIGNRLTQGRRWQQDLDLLLSLRATPKRDQRQHSPD
jgi:hypothetical protein